MSEAEAARPTFLGLQLLQPHGCSVDGHFLSPCFGAIAKTNIQVTY